ncbi:MAG: methionine biosynthesis protein MetW, partial [Candidatus Uhrbacteria bacterium]
MNLILILIVFLVLLTVALAANSFAPWVPAHSRDLKRIAELADLKSGELFFDLGCGDGRTVCYLARQEGVRASGIEMAVPLYLVCKTRQIFQKNSQINFHFGDLFKSDISTADVVYVFGMPKRLAKL